MPEFVQNTKRILPHLQVGNSVLFISWRQAFNLPKHVIDAIREKELSLNLDKISNLEQDIISAEIGNIQIDKFYHYDTLLDKLKPSRIDLSKPPYRTIIIDSILHDEGVRYDLYAYCIMPNHIHIVLKPVFKSIDKYYSIAEIMKTLKSVTAHKINAVTNSKGKVWMTESYDHIIRDEKELVNILNYVINNPVKAGLADKWDEWEGTYISKRFTSVE